MTKHQNSPTSVKPKSVKSRVTLSATNGSFVPDTTPYNTPYFSRVLLENSTECYVFCDATKVNGNHDFSLCNMKLPSSFQYVPCTFSNNNLAFGAPITINPNNQDLNTLAILNLGIANIGHFCFDNASGAFKGHGSSLCAALARATSTSNVPIVFKFPATSNIELKTPVKDNIGGMKVDAQVADYYLIALILPDGKVIYHATRIDVNTTEEGFRKKLEIFTHKINSSPPGQNYWETVGVDIPIVPVWNDKIEAFIVTDMFFIDTSTKTKTFF